jgi:SpoVK/Ycf46/Vps4 family AAA+-type ATPase
MLSHPANPASSITSQLSARLADFLGFVSAPVATRTFMNDNNKNNNSITFVPNSFYKAISQMTSHLEPEPVVSSSSALTRPFIQSFLASKHFVANNKKEILSVVAKLLGLGLSALTTYFLLKWLMKSLDPTNEDKVAAQARAERILKQIGMSNIELNEYELFIAANIVMPHQIDCSWSDIGGLEHLIDDLRETVIYPLKDFDAYYGMSSDSVTSVINKRSRLIQPPKGVLLFGVRSNL